MRSSRQRHCPAHPHLFVAALLVLFAGPAMAQAPCRSLQLDGDQNAATALRLELAARGVPVDAAGGCARVTVRAVAGGLELVLTDPHGRREVRNVVSVATAATLAESLLVTPRVPAPPAPAAPPASAPQPADPPAGPAARSERPTSGPGDSQRARYSVRLFAPVAIASDGSRWVGAGAALCVRVGQWCLGVRGRYWVDTGGAPPRGEVTVHRRHAGTAQLHVTLRIDAGPVVLGPFLAAGLGWMRTDSAQGSEAFQTRDVPVESSLGVALSVPMSKALAFDVALVADASVVGREVEIESGDPAPQPPEAPRYWLGATIGAHWGGP